MRLIQYGLPLLTERCKSEYKLLGCDEGWYMHMRACEKQPTVKISSLYTSSYFFKPGKPGRCGRPGRPSVLRLGGILCSRSSDAVERDRVRCGLSSWGRDMLTFIYIAIPDYRQSYDAALLSQRQHNPVLDLVDVNPCVIQG